MGADFAQVGFSIRDHRSDARVGGIQADLVFLLDALGVVAQRRDPAGDIGPMRAESNETFVKDFLARLFHAKGKVRIQRADAADAGLQAVFAQGQVNIVEIVFAHLDDRAELFVE